MASLHELERTTSKLGIHIPASTLSELVCDYSEPDSAANLDLYRRVNALFLSKVDQGFTEYGIYVTGEMQAVRGPEFRLACREAYSKHGTRFQMIGNLPDLADPAHDPVKVVEWWRDEWRALQPIDRFDILFCFANSIIDLYALPERASLHFMVFVGKYILVQEEHVPGEAKRMWVLQGTDRLLEAFRHAAAKARACACHVSPIFTDTILSLNCIESLHLLAAVSDHRRVPKDAVPSEIASSRSLSALTALGFVQETPVELLITDLGDHYLDFLLSQIEGS